MSFVPYPYTPMEFEDIALATLRDTYVKGDMEIEQFERCVGEVLRGEFGCIPMGGLPAPAYPAFQTETISE